MAPRRSSLSHSTHLVCMCTLHSVDKHWSRNWDRHNNSSDQQEHMARHSTNDGGHRYNCKRHQQKYTDTSKEVIIVVLDAREFLFLIEKFTAIFIKIEALYSPIRVNHRRQSRVYLLLELSVFVNLDAFSFIQTLFFRPE